MGRGSPIHGILAVAATAALSIITLKFYRHHDRALPGSRQVVEAQNYSNCFFLSFIILHFLFFTQINGKYNMFLTWMTRKKSSFLNIVRKSLFPFVLASNFDIDDSISFTIKLFCLLQLMLQVI